MITYTDSAEGISPDALKGFFVGWAHPPSPETHLRALKNSDHVMLALEDETGRIAGFITAVSDGVLSAYIPLLEVVSEYQGKGIGKELARRMLARLNGLYMVDLLCDRDLEPFYTDLGMRPGFGMMIRNYEKQSGE